MKIKSVIIVCLFSTVVIFQRDKSHKSVIIEGYKDRYIIAFLFR